MKAHDLKDLLAQVPDHHEVGIEVVSGGYKELIPFDGKSDKRFDSAFALVCRRDLKFYSENFYSPGQ